jgi:hypothetical protein
LSCNERAEYIAQLAELDVKIVPLSTGRFRYEQERVGDGYSEPSPSDYATEDAAILAAAENWSIGLLSSESN